MTLIEIMIAVLIVGILMALAYPSYSEQVVKSRRADGRAMLYEAAMKQQQYYTVNNSYTSNIGANGLGMAASSPEGYYRLSIDASRKAYRLTATRVSPQDRDTKCGDLTLNHLSVKGNKNATLRAGDCW